MRARGSDVLRPICSVSCDSSIDVFDEEQSSLTGMSKSAEESFENVAVTRDLIDDTVDYAIANGIVLNTINDKGQTTGLIEPFPLTLFPTPVCKDSLKFLTSLQTDVNKLMHLVVEDRQFLVDSLQGVEDDFTQRLLKIYKRVTTAGKYMVPELAIVRTDYMFDFDPETEKVTPKHIETNTIASASIGTGTQKMKNLHTRVVTKAKLSGLETKLPENKSAKIVAEAMVEAWKLYGNPEADIVFLTVDDEPNVYDQRQMEYEVNYLNPEIGIRRLKFSNLPGRTYLKEDGTLHIDGIEAALVYFRAAYHPLHYATEKVWKVRQDIELSRAIKCPSVGQQLFGCKKMQEVLARPGVLERFLNKEAANRMRKTFCGLYSLEMNEDGDSTVKKALKDPHKYVLKPQREGGGNNLFGDEIFELLNKIGSDKRRTAYILMDFVRPNPTSNYIIRNRQATKMEIVSELGIYGIYISSNGELVKNITAGHLLRSKDKDKASGGIGTGIAAVDSTLLI